MDNDVPIAPECQEVVSKAVEKVQSGVTFTASQLTEWIESPCPELQAIAFTCFYERSSRCESYPLEKRDAFFMRFLEKSISEDHENDFLPRRFDALLYCSGLIEQECKTRATRLTREIAKLLGEFCSISDQAIQQQVIDVVLEHVFHDKDVQKCFSFWRSSKTLRPLFDEGLELAGKWEDFYGKKSKP